MYLLLFSLSLNQIIKSMMLLIWIFYAFFDTDLFCPVIWISTFVLDLFHSLFIQIQIQIKVSQYKGTKT